MSAVGVDACDGGWIAAVGAEDAALEFRFFPAISELSEQVPDAGIVAIDIPIGLPLVGARRADSEARRFLGRSSSSVFPVPARSILTAGSYEAANAVSRDLSGKGLSKQTYALGTKILEVEAWMSVAPTTVFEVHPEVCFRAMPRPPKARKKSWHGVQERLRALADVGLEIVGVDPWAGERAAVDDILDAAAALWTARRLVAGTAFSLPDPPEEIEGRGVAIWV
jgi:predicted RNase H-like nuclease